jgi:hypothetical protein
LKPTSSSCFSSIGAAAAAAPRATNIVTANAASTLISL